MWSQTDLQIGIFRFLERKLGKELCASALWTVELCGKLEFTVLDPGVGRITMYPLVAWRLTKGSFALRGDLLCPRRQSRQNAAGDASE